MQIPDWYALLLLGLAAFRSWKLIGDDTILDRPRKRSMELAFKFGGAKGKNYWETLLECPWCAGFWVSLIWWGLWEAWPHGTLVASAPLAISAIVGLIGSVFQSDE